MYFENLINLIKVIKREWTLRLDWRSWSMLESEAVIRWLDSDMLTKMLRTFDLQMELQIMFMQITNKIILQNNRIHTMYSIYRMCTSQNDKLCKSYRKRMLTMIRVSMDLMTITIISKKKMKVRMSFRW